MGAGTASLAVNDALMEDAQNGRRFRGALQLFHRHVTERGRRRPAPQMGRSKRLFSGPGAAPPAGAGAG